MKTEIQMITECYEICGEKIWVNVPVRIDCRTQQPVFDEKIDSFAVGRALACYRQQHQLLTANQIKQARQRLGLSRREAAQRVGCSLLAMVIYEQGALPSERDYQALVRVLLKS